MGLSEQGQWATSKNIQYVEEYLSKFPPFKILGQISNTTITTTTNDLKGTTKSIIFLKHVS